MGKAKSVLATQELVEAMLGRFRQTDVDEVYAMSGRDINTSVLHGFKDSELCWIGTWEDDPFVIFGVKRAALLSDDGIPWMLGTDLMLGHAEIKKAFIEQSGFYILQSLKRFKYLENFVDARNKAALRWLKMGGFTIEAPQPAGFLQLPFHKFWLRR